MLLLHFFEGIYAIYLRFFEDKAITLCYNALIVSTIDTIRKEKRKTHFTEFPESMSPAPVLIIRNHSRSVI